MSEKRVWVFCGGISSERNISILSARNVVSCLLPSDFTVEVCCISATGQWWRLHDPAALVTEDPDQLVAKARADRITCLAGESQPLRLVSDVETPLPCYCIFSVLHGTGGEDGAMQGCWQTMQLPFVGCDALSSAVCMAKHVTKTLLAAADIPVAPGCVLYKNESHSEEYYLRLVEHYGTPLFIKPSRQGSSVGISKVASFCEFQQAVELAFYYDDIVLVEQAMVGREIECSVMGNDDVVVSVPGEIISHDEFYSFDAKYVNQAGATVCTPARLTDKERQHAQALSKKVYRVLGCTGMARVDLFLQPDGALLVNEVNTLPGFTEISLYPKNWQASGREPQALVEALIELGREQYQRNQRAWQQAQHLNRTFKQTEASS